MIEQPPAHRCLPILCCQVHREELGHIHISGIGTVDIQPPHHREVAEASKVAHRFDMAGVQCIPWAITLDIRNIVRIEPNRKELAMVENTGVPHLPPSGLVILDRSAGVEEPPPLGLRLDLDGPIGGSRHRSTMGRPAPRPSRRFALVAMWSQVWWFGRFVGRVDG